MPPVFGPRSPSSSRLWSRAGASGSTAEPSVSAITDSSGPSSRSSTSNCTGTDRGGGRPQLVESRVSPRRRCRRRRRPSLPRGRRASPRRRRGRMSCFSRIVEDGGLRGRHSGAGHHVLRERLGRLDARRRGVGPKQGMRSCANRSARPSASGASGPTTTRSGFSQSAAAASASAEPAAGTQARFLRNPRVAGDGDHLRAARRRCAHRASSARTKACSRAPDPITTALNGISA